MKYYNEDTIMSESRHQFIYGDDGKEREIFLKELEKKYPIKMNKDFPMAIYLDEYGFPKIPSKFKNIDINITKICALEYLKFTIIYNILLKTYEQKYEDILYKKIIDTIGDYLKYLDSKDINNFEELIKQAKKARDYYYKYYTYYMETGNKLEVPSFPHVELSSFIKSFKKVINNNSYFAIIIDKQHDLALVSTKAINSFVASRINSDISMKVAVSDGRYEAYTDLSGQFIEECHDYAEVYLEDNLSKYIKKKKL